MSLLSYDEERARSRNRRPFSNGFECDTWMDSWCQRCRNDTEEQCPLLTVVFADERTPAAWTDVQPGGLADRYRCEDFAPVLATPNLEGA
jgi:hypothetical protein